MLLHSTGKKSTDSLVHTDSYVREGWDSIPEKMIAVLEQQDGFVLEGCQAARVLRRWYTDDPDGPRLDKVVIFSVPRVKRTAVQDSYARGIRTVIDGLLPLLHRAKVKVEMNPDQEYGKP